MTVLFNLKPLVCVLSLHLYITVSLYPLLDPEEELPHSYMVGGGASLTPA